MTQVRNAGAIFMGEYSSEPLGDYFAGPNHVLPTNGTAKFSHRFGDDVKKSSIIYYSKKALKPVSRNIIHAESEYLTAHANSIRVRFEDDKGNRQRRNYAAANRYYYKKYKRNTNYS